MDAVAPAILVMLACSPDAQVCREVRLAAQFANIEDCRAALPLELRKMRRQGQPVVGRCETGAAYPAVDPIVTGAVEDRLATVRVTRRDNGRANTTVYRVPKTAP